MLHPIINFGFLADDQIDASPELHHLFGTGERFPEAHIVVVCHPI
jgi:hypothetical protein